MGTRIVFHIDMDAFFAAIEERNNPHLKGKPIVVGADPKEGRGRGVVSTANYEARKYGIHSAMPISQAWRLCPQAVFLPVDFPLYLAVSREIREALRGFGYPVEQASIDEFYLDATALGSWEKAGELAKEIKEKVFAKEKLTSTIGIGPNKLIAKIASERKKPDGLTVVPAEKVSEFLSPLEVLVLPGVGPKTVALLESRGITLIEDLRKIPKDELTRWFGRWGEDIFEKAHGRDERPVGEEEETKSIGEQETFALDTLKQSFLTDRLMQLCESVWHSFLKEKVRPRTVTLTIRFFDFETKNRSRTLPEPLESLDAFKSEALRLLLPFLDRRENPYLKKIRLLGIRGEKLAGE